MFPELSNRRWIELKLLQAKIIASDIITKTGRHVRQTIVDNATVICSVATFGLVLLVLFYFWHPLWAASSTRLAKLSNSVLLYGRNHPHFLKLIRVGINSFPDITVSLLGLAGLGYLMPNVTKKLETTWLRFAVAAALIVFCILSIGVNAINRTEQDNNESEHTRAEIENGQRLYEVQKGVTTVQGALIESKGKMSEVDRRKQILESLRQEYVITHKSAPITMITGNLYPPTDWMIKRLKELGETWPYLPPADQLPSQANQQPAPDLEIMIATGNDEATSLRYNNYPNWMDQERHCETPFKCYPERDYLLPSAKVEIAPATKGWARLMIVLFNTGGSTLIKPNVQATLSGGHGVSINAPGDHNTTTNESLEFKAPAFKVDDLIPFKLSHTSTSMVCDLVIDRTIEYFSISIRVYGDNMEARIVNVPFVVR